MKRLGPPPVFRPPGGAVPPFPPNGFPPGQGPPNGNMNGPPLGPPSDGSQPNGAGPTIHPDRLRMLGR